jgi:hypothetical protein
MKISYAITVCNELEEIKKLIPILLENKYSQDEIVILFDEKNGSTEVLDYLLTFNKLPNVQTWRKFDFNGDFAEWKNSLNEYCSGDYIFQLDADELVDPSLIQNIHSILDMNTEIDLFVFSRINTVKGITNEHIQKWGWKVNDKGWINFPDIQGRLYRKGLKWYGKVHERIGGAKFYSLMPSEEVYCIQHHKDIERQEKQNNLYQTL